MIYNRGIDEMKAKGVNKFLIFSDDMTWCKENLVGSNFHFMEGNNPIEDLFAMSSCKHNIICNSSFSWWGSWLNKNPDKIVIAPQRWFGLDCNYRTHDLYCKNWIII